ncbi:nuclear speckle splicing regulatory protein 1 [Lampris incognitus]|uniref:nuclear speckle splicing regulatory protein 1 n=1 Tax=Lampris incognitus TaxID=2546036 RepID=UPI0024B4A305|nr:nuclear speckle splicing regulatory protein 1 [Lampris incognitus]
MAAPGKQYGLILPQKKGAKTTTLQRPSVFGDDSDDETTVGESLQKEAVKKRMMKQTHLEMQKALEQDSTVYDYDAVYDDIQKQRLEDNKKILGGTDRKPKYINQLLKAVEERKKEQERRDERKIQKEREEEGEQFADKEAYVTSAYRKKLQERKEEEERERREAEMEAALDVRKQKDLSGFYRHLLNQTVGEEAIPDRCLDKDPSTKPAKAPERISPPPSPASHDNAPSSNSENEEGHDQKSGFNKPGLGSTHSKRHYRQRSPSSGSGDDKERERERNKQKKSHRDRDRGRERDRERDDRRNERRDDKDRRRDRERDREDDRGRGRRDTDREDKHAKRERSLEEKERDKNGEREKRGNHDEDKGKEKHREKVKEKRKDSEKEKVVKTEEKDAEEKEEGADDRAENQGEEKEEKVNKFAKRSSDHTVTSARDRYLARQMARSACKTYIEKEED